MLMSLEEQIQMEKGKGTTERDIEQKSGTKEQGKMVNQVPIDTTKQQQHQRQSSQSG